MEDQMERHMDDEMETRMIFVSIISVDSLLVQFRREGS